MILCFSGTGNTARCALRLAELLGEHVQFLSGEELLNPAHFELHISDSRLIWAFPVYSWGMPPVMVRYISEIRAGENFRRMSHYMLATCGDDMGYTNHQWEKLMLARGWHAVASYTVIMPNTYVAMRGFNVDTPETAERKIRESDATIIRIARLIGEESTECIHVHGAMAALKSNVIYPLFVRFKMSPRPFGSTVACVGCSLCASSCPMDNITMTSQSRPEWGADCAMCLRCYHICPQHAVTYGRVTATKGQWQGAISFLKLKPIRRKD